MPKAVSLWKQAIVAALIVGGAGFAWTERAAIATALGIAEAEKSQSRDPSSGAVPVLVETVSVARDDIALEAVGTGRARRSVTLRPETEGKVIEVPIATGQRYEVGDILMRLDDAEQRLSVRLAEARLAEAIRVRDRITRLRGAGAAAASRLDEVETAAVIAAIELERAEDALENRIVKAPFDGVAGLTDVEVGAWIGTDTAIASFDDRSIIAVEFDLPEALLARVRPGLSVTATTPAAPGETFEGTVTAIDSRVAAQSRTVRIRVGVPNPDDKLRPGASFTVRLALPGAEFPTVPELAIQFSRGALHVWQETDGAAQRVEVRMIRRRDGAVLVDAPLAEGDRVIVEGTQRLSPGKAVRVLDGPGRGNL